MFFLALWAFFSLCFCLAYSNRAVGDKKGAPVRLKTLAISFLLYTLLPYAIGMLGSAALQAADQLWGRGGSPYRFLWLQLAVLWASSCLVVFYLLQKDQTTLCAIFFAREARSAKKALLAGVLALPLAFPCVAFTAEIVAYFAQGVMQQAQDQLAVRFLKQTQNSTALFISTSLTMVVIVPLMEELLFRGLLQNYLRKFLDPSPALCISALAFALFHFSTEQGGANLPIIASLWVFALFLGKLYELQGSLLSCFALHGSYNLLTIMWIAWRAA